MGTLAEKKSERLELRLSGETKRILLHAAAVRHKTVTEFVIDSSVNAAYGAIADQRAFLLDEKQWAALAKRLKAPSKPNPRLRRLMARKPRWER